VLPSAGLADVKMSAGLLLAMREPARDGAVRVEVVSAENGQVGQMGVGVGVGVGGGGWRVGWWGGAWGERGVGGDVGGDCCSRWLIGAAARRPPPPRPPQLLARHALPLQPGVPQELEVVELFGDRLLIKQPRQPLRIYDVRGRGRRLCAPAASACKETGAS
jgi:hypothetical protein